MQSCMAESCHIFRLIESALGDPRSMDYLSNSMWAKKLLLQKSSAEQPEGAAAQVLRPIRLGWTS